MHSSSGTQLPDGSYRFTGDYLLDIYSSGTQYLFNWQFSPTGNGNALWNGNTAWVGGHIWNESISGVTVVPEPGTQTLIVTSIAVFWAFRRWRRSHL